MSEALFSMPVAPVCVSAEHNILAHPDPTRCTRVEVVHLAIGPYRPGRALRREAGTRAGHWWAAIPSILLCWPI